jgi:NAD(P)H-nitrite reductase large subunit
METQAALYTLAGLVITTLCTVVGVLWGKIQAMQKEQANMGVRLDKQAERIGYADAMSHAVSGCRGGTPCPLAQTFQLQDL